MKKMPVSLIIISIGILFVASIAIGIIFEWIQFEDIYYNFMSFIFVLVVISFLAVVGAIFLGMFISHRIFSARQFTTFEKEMLEMKKDVEDMKEKIDEMSEKD